MKRNGSRALEVVIGVLVLAVIAFAALSLGDAL